MPDTAPDKPRTLHAVPDPKPPAGLTGAPAAIYDQLTTLTEPVTAVELALAAGVGRSTAGKALTTLENKGLALRTPGSHDGPRRTPDHWRAAPTDTNNDSGNGTSAPAPALAEPSSADATVPSNGEPGAHEEVGSTTMASAAPAADEIPIHKGEHPGDDTGEKSDVPRDGGSDGADSEEDVAIQAGPGQPTAAPAQTATHVGEKKRLAPGALRQMVIDHLQAHPSEAFTATKISRIVEKSSGAIANVLEKLAKQGIAEQVTDRPRTYQLAAPDETA